MIGNATITFRFRLVVQVFLNKAIILLLINISMAIIPSKKLNPNNILKIKKEKLFIGS